MNLERASSCCCCVQYNSGLEKPRLGVGSEVDYRLGSAQIKPMMLVLANDVSSEPIVKSWSLIIALTIYRPTDRPNYFEKPLADPEASVKHSGKEVRRV